MLLYYLTIMSELANLSSTLSCSACLEDSLISSSHILSSCKRCIHHYHNIQRIVSTTNVILIHTFFLRSVFIRPISTCSWATSSDLVEFDASFCSDSASCCLSDCTMAPVRALVCWRDSNSDWKGRETKIIIFQLLIPLRNYHIRVIPLFASPQRPWLLE